MLEYINEKINEYSGSLEDFDDRDLANHSAKLGSILTCDYILKLIEDGKFDEEIIREFIEGQIGYLFGERNEI